MSELPSESHNVSQNVSPNAAGPDRTRGGRGPLLRWFLVVFLLFGALGAYAILQRKSERTVLAQQTEQISVPYVAVIHATPIPSDSQMVLPGALKAYVDSPIYARTNGYLKKWYRDIGSHVKRGEILAEIDTPEVDEQLSQARAELATAQANVTLSRITATRYEGLLKTDSVSQQDVDNAKGDLAAKQAMLQSAQANVKRLEDLESFKRVYAPFSGIITQRNVDPGTLINAGNGGSATKEMFDLAQIDPIRAFVAVPQSFSPSIHIGAKACLTLSEIAGRNFCGKIVRTANTIDPSTRTLLTEVDVPNRNGTLLPGAYAQVHFDVKLPGMRLSLPVNAILFRPEGTVVAVVKSDNRLAMKKITIGRDFGKTVEVLEGIDTTDRIVINPPDSLEQDEMVRISTQAGSSANAPQTQGSKH
ncbi:MAG TPA: efflux RND transporter periplasmic adaptor subunit [Candidatus Dormibacteraeota bacterium]|nr:efflux RND transporter periplasmic adaptor subunit [Candidatus Dormibacteraeota bacterium]